MMESTSRKFLEGRKEGGRNHEQKMKFTKRYCEIKMCSQKIGAELRERTSHHYNVAAPSDREKDVRTKTWVRPASQSSLKQPAPIGTASRFFGQSQ